MHNIKAIAQTIADILKVSYIGTLYACLGMSSYTQQNYGDQFIPLMELYMYAKNQNHS